MQMRHKQKQRKRRSRKKKKTEIELNSYENVASARPLTALPLYHLNSKLANMLSDIYTRFSLDFLLR